MKKVALQTTTAVTCNGKPCGTVHDVVVRTADNHITDLVVDRGNMRKDRIVPVSLVTGTQDGTVELGLDPEDLGRYPTQIADTRVQTG